MRFKCEVCPFLGMGTPCPRIADCEPGSPAYSAEERANPVLAKPMWEQMRAFGDALVKHAQNGFREVPKGVQEERLSICRKCVHYDANFVRCLACGCYLMKKTAWATEECPIGLWGTAIDEKAPTNPSPPPCGCH
jgi:hypothetical protein